MTVRIVTDSTCDLPVEIIKSLKICVVPLYVRIGNHDFLDGIDISREEFYEKMLFYEDYPTTAVPMAAIPFNIMSRFIEILLFLC